MLTYLKRNYRNRIPQWGNIADVERAVAINLEKIYRIDPASIVLAMPMWESAGDVVHDYSGKNNHGANYGATWESGSLDFDGDNDYVNCGDNISFNNTSFSVLHWLKSTDASMRTVQTRSTGAWGAKTGWQISINATNWGNTGIDDNTNYLNFVSVLDMAAIDGKLHFVTLTWDTLMGVMKLYIDSVLIGTETDTNMIGANLDSTDDLEIGRANSGAQYLNGLIPEVNIFNIDLTADQIALMYDLPHALYQPVARVSYFFLEVVEPEPELLWKKLAFEDDCVLIADVDASGYGFFLDEDDMVSNDPLKFPSQQSVKTYAKDAVDKKHDQNTDTHLGTVDADIDMDTHQLENLAVPDANGEAIRATAKITESNLEDTIDESHSNSDDHAAGSDDQTGAEMVTALEALSPGSQLSHDELDDVSADDHHNESHNAASHSDLTSSGATIESAVSASHTQGTDTALGAQAENLDMNTHKIVGVIDPTANQEAATKKYVDDNAGGGDVKFEENLDADGKYSGITCDGVMGDTLAFGDLVYLAPADGSWELADADREATAGDVMLGIVVTGGNDGDTGLILLSGFVREDDWNFVVKGKALYVHTTAGEMSQVVPSDAGDIVRVVGYAHDNADTIYFNPSSIWGEI